VESRNSFGVSGGCVSVFDLYVQVKPRASNDETSAAGYRQCDNSRVEVQPDA